MLINADTDQDIRLLQPSDVINFAEIGTNRLSVRADVAGGVQSVRFRLDANANFRTENSDPYSLAGDTAGNYTAWTPSLGNHTLRATPYSLDSAAGTIGTHLEVSFSVVNQSGPPANGAPVLGSIDNRTVTEGQALTVNVSATDPNAGDAIALVASGLPAFGSFIDNGNRTGTLTFAPGQGAAGVYAGITVTATDNGSPVATDAETFTLTVVDDAAPPPPTPTLAVTSLSLVNADTDQIIEPALTDGYVIDFAAIGTRNLSVRANATAAVKSVRFGWDATANYRTENSAPFTIAGDTAGDYTAWTPTVGGHVLKATGYSATKATGTASATVVLNLTVTEGDSLTATPGQLAFTIPQNDAVAPQAFTVGTSDGVATSFTAFADALWLSVTPSGNTGDPVTVTVDATALPLGTHRGYVTLKSPTHATVEIPVTLTVTGAFVADQVHVSYPGNPATSFAVVWRTMSTATPSEAQYRLAGSGDAWTTITGAPRTSGTTGRLHQANVTGLAADTAYEYRVRGDGDAAWSTVYATHTLPPVGNHAFSFVFFGDTGLLDRADGLSTGAAQAIAEMARLDPDLLLPGGDYIYYNTDQRFGTLDNSIDAWFNQNQRLMSSVPIMPTLGNHEVLLGESASKWQQRFASPQGYNGQENYSFDVGDVHFVSIQAVSDTAALTTASFNWVKADLQAAVAAGRKWIVPYMHVPAFADGTSHPSNTALRAQLGPLFEQHGVQLVLSSHDQSYERTYPLSGVPSNITRTSTALTDYGPDDGVVWLKVSPAGKLSNRNGVNDFSKFKTNPPPFWTAVRDDTMHHVTKVSVLQGGTLRVETYAFTGDGAPPIVIDAFDIHQAAHAAAAPATAPMLLASGEPNPFGATETEPDRIEFDDLAIA